MLVRDRLGLGTTNIVAIAILATFSVGCVCHFLWINVLPMGFYIDESSIGYNAYTIARTGVDEHGTPWPLFFEAFGEYKNPLYIYALAALYRIFGYSEWTTRAVSAFCWVAGSGCLYALGRRLFEDEATRLYLAICLAFTPWVFSLSRIAFELIFLYPLLALHLLALYRGFEEHSRRWVIVSGVAMGACVYAYTTFRLLAPIYVAGVLLCYRARQFRTSQILFSLSAALTAVPFLFYALNHLDHLSKRFGQITFLRDPALSLLQRGEILISNYAGYFSPAFLALAGDPNRRHHTGFGGELLIPTVLLLVVALVVVRRHWQQPFVRYLLAGLLFAPIAAALTEDPHHSLRAFSMVVFAIVLSAYGLQGLKPVLARSMIGLTAACAVAYTLHYFLIYPPESAVAFENFGFKQTLIEALSRSQGRVILSEDGNVPYINLLFFGSMVGARAPMLVGTLADARPGDAYIFYARDQRTTGLYELSIIPGAVSVRK